MNEDKQFVPVERLREAEARAERAEGILYQVYRLTVDNTYSAFSALGEINHITEPYAAHDAGKDAK